MRWPWGNRFVIHLDLVQVHISLGNKAQARQHLEAAEALASHARSLQVAVLYLLKAQLLDADGDVAALDAALQGLRLSERYRMGELSEVPFGRLPDSLQKASSLALDLAVKHAPPEGLVEVLEIRRTQHLAATESGPRVLEAGQEQQAVLDSAKKKLVVLKDIRAASLEIGKPEMPLRPFSRLLQLDRELAKNLVMGEGQLNPNRLQEQIARLEQILSRNALGNGEVPGVSLASRGSLEPIREALRSIALKSGTESRLDSTPVIAYLFIGGSIPHLLTIADEESRTSLVRLPDATTGVASGPALKPFKDLGDRLARVLPEGRFTILVIDHSVEATWSQLVEQSADLARLSQVSLVPSGSFLAQTVHREAEEAIAYLSIVDPTEDLPYSSLEGTVLGGMTKATILRGAQCSRAAVASIFGRHSRLDVLHFACHAVYDPHDQPKSYMQLHPEVTLLGGYYRDIGRLSTDDIAAWKGTASIVILAACESAASSKEMFGTDSFPATFLRRGTRSVVAALWPVDDKAGLLFVWLFLVGLCAGRSVLYARFTHELRTVHCG